MVCFSFSMAVMVESFAKILACLVYIHVASSCSLLCLSEVYVYSQTWLVAVLLKSGDTERS